MNVWDELRKTVNQIHKLLESKPEEERASFSLAPGSILNAYREGDISFQSAEEALEEWRKLDNDERVRQQMIADLRGGKL